jgi:hypothetical protein
MPAMIQFSRFGPMTDFATRFAALGISQAQWRRWIERHSTRRLEASTVSRLVTGKRLPNPTTEALLAAAERHPAVLAEIRELGR